jgi:hypothetical protein
MSWLKNYWICYLTWNRGLAKLPELALSIHPAMALNLPHQPVQPTGCSIFNGKRIFTYTREMVTIIMVK